MEQESAKPLSHYRFHAGGIVSSGLLLMPPILGIIKGFLPEALYYILVGIYVGVLVSVIVIQFMKVSPFPPHKSRGFKIWKRDRKGNPV